MSGEKNAAEKSLQPIKKNNISLWGVKKQNEMPQSASEVE